MSHLQLVTEHTERKEQLDNILSLQLTCVKQAKTLQDNKVLIKEYKQQTIEYKSKANYWEKQFSQLKTKEKELKNEIEELKADLRKREQQLFVRKSEKNSSKSEKNNIITSKNKRGQQPKNKAPKRRNHDNLPTVIEDVSLNPDSTKCNICDLAYIEMPTTEDSEIIGIINVKPHKRIIRRKKYKRGCCCKKNPDPGFITAPTAPKIIPKSSLDSSVWAHLLLKKFEYQLPINRILKELAVHGLDLASGTVVGGLRKFIPILLPVYNAVNEYSLAAKHWHADETRWKVFEEIDGKTSNNWYLWVFKNDETVLYKKSPSRSSQLLIGHFGQEHHGGTLNVDRYAAYKVIAKSGLFILAFCWAHVRRDFLSYAKGYPDHEQWALNWVDMIANLYHINNKRIICKPNTANFKKHDKQLRKAIDNMQIQYKAQLQDESLLPSAKKILTSLDNHWDGLTVFIERPSIPMDNNPAENAIRLPVLGRNSYNGSGSEWSFELTVIIFTILATIKLWGLNIHTWLISYLDMCALNGGKPPDSIDNYLPWNMSEQQKELFAQTLKHEDSG